jgi:general secretion pathway protein M
MTTNAKAIWLAWCVITLAAIAVIGSVAWMTVQKYRVDESRLAEVEPRFARFLGIKAAVSDLDKSIEEVQVLIDKNVYPSSQEVSQVGNAAQQRVRETFTAAGLEVVSSQILPAKPVKAFERIAISVRVEGSLLGFQSAMAALSAVTPTVWVEGFSIQVMGTPTAAAPQRLNIALNLYVLRNL